MVPMSVDTSMVIRLLVDEDVMVMIITSLQLYLPQQYIVDDMTVLMRLLIRKLIQLLGF